MNEENSNVLLVRAIGRGLVALMLVVLYGYSVFTGKPVEAEFANLTMLVLGVYLGLDQIAKIAS